LFGEYHFERITGDGDLTVAGALDKQVASDTMACGTDQSCIQKQSDFKTRLHNQNANYITLGLRLRPVAGLVLDPGVDLAAQSPRFAFGPPLPAWNVILGAAYAYDMTSGKNVLKTKTITRTYEVTRRAPEGHFSARVIDANTKQPVRGALV